MIPYTLIDHTEKDNTLRVLTLLTMLENYIAMLEYSGDYNAVNEDDILRQVNYIRHNVLKKLVKTE